jgi:site-specific DNA-methyltransferase (adenine-specific)
VRPPPADLALGRQRLYFHSSEAMPEVSDRSVDVVVTSPPYNRGKRYHERYSDRQPLDSYLGLLDRVFRECYRVLRPGGTFFLNVGDSGTDQGKSESVVRQAQSAGFHRHQTLIWVKSLLGRGHLTPVRGEWNFSNVFEYVYVLVREPPPRLNVLRAGIPYADKSNIGRYRPTDLRDAGNVWFIPYSETTGSSVKKGHEAPFPVELPLRAIQCVPDASRVLDPFAGTGATLAAAEALGIEGIGYEAFPRPEVIRRRLSTLPSVPPIVLLPELERAVRTLGTLLPPEGAGTAGARWDEARSVLRRLGPERGPGGGPLRRAKSPPGGPSSGNG